MRSLLFRSLTLAVLAFAAFASKPPLAHASTICGVITNSPSCPIGGSPESTFAACQYLFPPTEDCVPMMYSCEPNGFGYDIECRNANT